MTRSLPNDYNNLKKRALEVFERQGGWIGPSDWAVLAGFCPIRSAYSYLLRSHRFGLLMRRPLTGAACTLLVALLLRVALLGRPAIIEMNDILGKGLATDGGSVHGL